MNYQTNQTERDRAVSRQQLNSERQLAAMRYAFQVRSPGADWVTLAKGTGPDGLLMMMAGNRPEVERRILQVNTVVAHWAPGERAGDQ